MQRRTFLKSSSAVASASAWACTTRSGPSEGIQRVLLTSADHPLPTILADSLGATYEILLTSREEVDSAHPFQRSDLSHGESTNRLVAGIDAIVHVAEPLPDEGLHQQIDHLTRRTYNLLWAATNGGVQRVVYLSTLEVMAAYDPNFIVNESWQPLPTLTAPSLPKHLGEYTCREFARIGKLGKLAVVVLRLGKVVAASEMRGRSFDPMSVAEDDVGRLALQTERDTAFALSPSQTGFSARSRTPPPASRTGQSYTSHPTRKGLALIPSAPTGFSATSRSTTGRSVGVVL